MLRRLTLAACIALAIPAPARAQIRASEPASVSQTIDGTKLTVTYSRPRVRGRDPIFGSRAVRWGETWTPGANWATTLDVSRAITLGGRPVPKGTYSVWMVVRQGGDWTMVLEPKARLFHMDPPDSSAKQIRFPVRAETGPFTEVLTWSFPDVRSTGGTLALQWATTRVAMEIGVEPSLVTTLPETEAAPYLGRYAYTEMDTLGRPTRTIELVVLYENGTLKGEFVPEDGYMKRFALIRTGPDFFFPGIYDRDGKIYEVIRPDMSIEFTRANGKAETLEVRYDTDYLAARGKRKQ
ncbi:DUF2911 domain-containing protein [Roseisolibacter agri]|uniref:DUF2911 domain-containing protein n=1 Tax=Roseisolibacter agri TaxID=2014610 RepID=A0AA37QDA6_9BACT|nr:DUF2911 domain-containing protein [Roseisolibacter agri]GLC26796.1 hypothetical protein rosag_33090 [Roseisolibacter agri]